MKNHITPHNKTMDQEIIDDALLVLDNPEVKLFVNTSKKLNYIVINKNYQIVDISGSMLRYLGYLESSNCIGMRLGEIVNCKELCNAKNGCGTSESCIDCTCNKVMQRVFKDKVGVYSSFSIDSIGEYGIEEISMEIKAYPFLIEQEQFAALVTI